MRKEMERSSWVREPSQDQASNFKGTPKNMRIDSIILRELHVPLVRPFETSFGVTRNRRIVLAEVRSEGLTGWGECTAGERPFFSGESTDTAWQVIVNELGPMLASSEQVEHGGRQHRSEEHTSELQ